MRKHIPILLCIFALFSFPTMAAPADIDFSDKPALQTLSYADLPNNLTPEEHANILETYQDAIEYMYVELENRAEEIYLDEYYIPIDDFSALFYTVVNRDAHLFDMTDFCSYATMDGYIFSFYPTYTMTNEEYENNKTLYNMYIEELLHLGDGDLSDVEKILHLHDFMASHYFYDTEHSTGNAASTAFGLMHNKTGVCRAYCVVFEEILLRWGIPCITAISPDMMHAWNMVELDGKWYHIDLTWDDATPDFIGQTYHHFLLLDDTTMQSSAYNQDIHYNWLADNKATDNTYVNYFWDDNRSPFRNIGGVWYHLELDTNNYTTGLFAIDFKTHEKTPIHVTKNIWFNWTDSNRYYISTFGGIDTYDGWVIFNDALCLYAYHPETKEIKTLLDVTGSDKGYIYGSYIDDHVLYYGQVKDPAEKGCPVTGKIDLCPLFQNTHCELIYNANGGHGNFHTIPTCVTYTVEVTTSKPTLAYHEFLGWAKTPTATKPEFFAGDKIIMEGNLTLYAVWRSYWNISYKESSKNFSVTAESFENNAGQLFILFYDDKGRLISITREGITSKKSKSVKKPTGARAAGAFVWSDVAKLIPASDAIYANFTY